MRDSNVGVCGPSTLRAFAFAGAVACVAFGACGGNTSSADARGGAGARDAGGDAASDATIDQAHADSGAYGDAGTGGLLDASGTTDGAPGDEDDCPAYQSRCDGACVATIDDPDNCGGCGVRCTGDSVCSGGRCASSCPPATGGGDQGLVACGNRCVDLRTDNAHCGACDTACEPGEGCSAGRCVPTLLPTGDAPSQCAGGSGPPIVVETPSGGVCAGNLAQTTFPFAVCSCEGFRNNTDPVWLTDAYDSASGPYVPGGKGGSVGINGDYDSVASGDQIGGTLWIAGSRGRLFADIGQELHWNGDLTLSDRGSSATTVGGDAYVSGAIDGTMSVTGTLYTPSAPPSGVTYGKLAQQAVAVPPPCDCAPSKLLPIGDIVAARQSNNDNAAIGLDPDALKANSEFRLDLPCGHYYVTGIEGNAATIVAHGHTALYVDGDIRVNGNLQITLDPTASFDVFVRGSVLLNGTAAIGSPAYPALMRMYVEPTSPGETFLVNAGLLLAGELYIPTMELGANHDFVAYGAVFAKSFLNNDGITVHYDNAVTTVGDSTCAPPPGECRSCKDCNNQACVGGTCGACTQSSDCCAPLQCIGGKCVSQIVK